jgi:hypothetical protein
MAGGTAGEEFNQTLGKLTVADAAASTDLTGLAALGGIKSYAATGAIEANVLRARQI